VKLGGKDVTENYFLMNNSFTIFAEKIVFNNFNILKVLYLTVSKNMFYWNIMEISGIEPEITKCKFAVLPIKLYPL
jgi:hypothetical protein